MTLGRARNLCLPIIIGLLGACTTVNETAHCRTIDDDAARRACLERISAESETRDGVGPPSCHPASTNPDRDRDRC